MSEELRKQARGAFLSFNFQVAQTLYTRYLEQGNDDMGAVLHLAVCKEIAGDKAGAQALYHDYSQREGGSDALRENVRGRAMFQLAYPTTPSVYAEVTKDNAIVMSRLIAWGRFGNQILEHFWLQLHAQNHNLRLAVPYWLGRDLFGLADFILTNAAEFDEQPEEALPMADAVHASGPNLVGTNVKGFCQIHTKNSAPYKEVFRSLYRPIESLERDLDTFLKDVKGNAKTLIALHIRRTDYIGSKYDIGSSDWLKSWLKNDCGRLSDTVIYIASDDPNAVDEFSEFNSVSNRGFDFSVKGAEFMPDWWVLAHADKVAIANSSFSLTAAMFNSTASAMVRPSLDQARMVSFDAWDTHVLDEKAAD